MNSQPPSLRLMATLGKQWMASRHVAPDRQPLQSRVVPMRVCRWIGLFAFLLVAALAAGQQTSAGAGTAGIIGAVVDPQDALIPGASVEVTGDNVANHTIKANEVGAFALNGLPAGGTLHITIKATGFGDWH